MTREGDTISSTRAGVNTQLGLTYLLFPQLAAFLEWKYNHARFNFPTGPNTVGFHADYNPHAFVAGVTYMVNWASPISLREIMRDIFGE
jgi:opacity protein-like surface antigen